MTENDLNTSGSIYRGNDLGVSYTPSVTTFKVWAPGAEELRTVIYPDDKDPVYESIHEMKRGRNGIWWLELKGDFAGRYFTYKIKRKGEIRETVDPYTKCVGTNSRRGLIVDLEATDPPGWDRDERVQLDHYTDAIIYEIHVRDFSSSPHSGIENRRKYLGFTEKGTTNNEGRVTGLDHLEQLGITHVHLLPIFDFGSVDDEDVNQYNWGYDPLFYNSPEGSYATNPSDDTRIRELKKLIKALHDRGIGVIMDVVFNHTYSRVNSPFNLLVPRYYYRFNNRGHCTNGSGCGNELATEKPMVRKFIIDSVKYWVNEYHIDGFRFDLMALIDRTTMEEVERVLHDIDSSLLIYGEPWTGGETPLPVEERMIKGSQRGKKIAVFNDHFRNAIKGDNDGPVRGFVSGAKGRERAIKQGIVGSIEFNSELSNFCREPGETVNYISSHDNLTLWDKLARSNDGDSEIKRIKMDRLAQAIVLTSQGIPFIAGGEELLRTKYGHENSYRAGDRVNQIKWDRKTCYYSTFSYYRGLIKLRKNHPAFRMNSSHRIRDHLQFLQTAEGVVGFWLKNNANEDQWQHIVVIYNSTDRKREFTLPFSSGWKTVVNEVQSGTSILEEIDGRMIIIAPLSARVLFTKFD